MTKSIYKCNRCGKLYNHKGDYNRHINRKIPCKKLLKFPEKLVPKVRSPDEVTFRCPKCNTLCSSKSSLDKHITSSCPSNNRKNEVPALLDADNNDVLDHSNNSIYTVLEHQEFTQLQPEPASAHVLDNNDHSISETEEDNTHDVLEPQAHCQFSSLVTEEDDVLDGQDNDSYTGSDLIGIPQAIQIPSAKKQCPHCKLDFSKTNFSKHEKVCKQKATQLSVFKEKVFTDLQQENKAKDIAYNALREEIEQMKIMIELLQSEKKNSAVNAKNINSNNNSNNTIQTINNNNDIKVIAFGTEDLYSILDDNQAMKYLSRGYQAVYSLIEDMHFDPKKPEFHSVYISDKNRPNALQFNGDQWDTVEKDDVVDQLFDDKACYLNAMFKELRNKLNKKTIIKYSRFMNDTDKEVIESIKRDIRKLLYNKRHIPMATKKMLGL